MTAMVVVGRSYLSIAQIIRASSHTNTAEIKIIKQLETIIYNALLNLRNWSKLQESDNFEENYNKYCPVSLNRHENYIQDP